MTGADHNKFKKEKREREKMDDDIFYAGKLRCIP
jgi:hypothetical protein